MVGYGLEFCGVARIAATACTPINARSADTCSTARRRGVRSAAGLARSTARATASPAAPRQGPVRDEGRREGDETSDSDHELYRKAASVSQTTLNCPSCDSDKIISGRIARRSDSFSSSSLRLEGLRASLIASDIPIGDKHHVCTACGLVWSRVEPAEVGAIIAKKGSAALRRRLGLDANET